MYVCQVCRQVSDVRNLPKNVFVLYVRLYLKMFIVLSVHEQSLLYGAYMFTYKSH